ncbi:MAG: hypothetical protein KDJ52_23660 [Anaerolineae bacterium]|nr:hypothetical protein [Anaerolineae bacterium]
MNAKKDWVSSLVDKCNPLIPHADESRLINKLLDEVDNLQNKQVGLRFQLAAAFDLLVAAAYYGSVAHAGWIYCPSSAFGAVMFYPYTNACPICALKNEFVFHKAHKPQSGIIGAYTSRLLALFIQEVLKRKNGAVKVFKGTEPVDIIFLDETTLPATVMFAEIKAAPLFTLPLMVQSQQLTMETEAGIESMPHHETDNTQLFDKDLAIFLPFYDKNQWMEKSYVVGCKTGREDTHWAYRGLENLLNTDLEFFESFVITWHKAFESYREKSQNSIYWFTNASGQPFPRPDDWPSRKGSGYESVSDGKTSVGMDRTDDIKKAIYQVVKVGAEGRPTANYSFKVGIVSNIQPVRHFDDYFAALKDIIWTRDATGQVKLAKQLPPEAELYNLFDGIITLTQNIARDAWIEKTFDFLG